MCECANESASRPAFPLPPLCVEEEEEEVEPRWAGPSCEGRPIQCSMPDMSSPGPASSSEPDDESEHSGDRPSESQKLPLFVTKIFLHSKHKMQQTHLSTENIITINKFNC